MMMQSACWAGCFVQSQGGRCSYKPDLLSSIHEFLRLIINIERICYSYIRAFASWGSASIDVPSAGSSAITNSHMENDSSTRRDRGRFSLQDDQTSESHPRHSDPIQTTSHIPNESSNR